MLTATFFIAIVITLPFFSDAATPKKFCSKYKCEKLKGDVKIGHFAGNVINDRFLNDTTQKQFNAESESVCVRECVKDDPCRTISVVPDITSTKNVTCYLSESHIYKTQHFFQKGSKIISLGTDRCSSSPCPDGSKCEPNYETGGYSCSDIQPDVYFSFDKDLEPEHKDGASKLTPVTKKGSIAKVYDAKTPVLMMADGSDLSFSHTATNLGNPLINPRNLTFGMWVKYSGTTNEIVYTATSAGIWRITFQNGLYTFVMPRWGNIDIKLTYQMPNIRAYNTWHHIIIRVTKEVLKFTVNGKTRGEADISSDTNSPGQYRTLKLQHTSKKGIIGFLDSVSISNDYKSDEFVKEWYDREKKNYA